MPRVLYLLSAKPRGIRGAPSMVPPASPHFTCNPLLASLGIIKVTLSLQWPEHTLCLVEKCRMCFYNRVNFRLAEYSHFSFSRKDPPHSCMCDCLPSTHSDSGSQGSWQCPPQPLLDPGEAWRFRCTGVWMCSCALLLKDTDLGVGREVRCKKKQLLHLEIEKA